MNTLAGGACMKEREMTTFQREKNEELPLTHIGTPK